MTSQFSISYSRAYDLLNAGKPYGEEVRFLKRIFATLSKPESEINTVLDLGCGSGGHLAEFDDRITKFGIDQSEGMLLEASKKGIKNFQYQVADICNFELNLRFDLIYSLFHVVSYQTKSDELLAFFTSIKKHLSSDGICVVDFWHRSAWDLDPPVTRVTTRQDSETEVLRVSSPTYSLLDGVVLIEMDVFVKSSSSVQYDRISETHKMRAYTLLEISQAATLAGLEVVASGKWMEEDNPLSANDWYGWLACRRAK